MAIVAVTHESQVGTRTSAPTTAEKVHFFGIVRRTRVILSN